MASAKLEEVKLDIAELEALHKKATRKRVIDALSLEIRKLGTDLIKLQDEIVAEKPMGSNATQSNEGQSSAPATKHYEVKINGYGWDQSDKYVKVFVTLKDVHTVPKENVFCELKDKSMELRVKNLENKDYTLIINNLLYPINVDACHWKQKTDMVVVFLAKARQSNHWSHMTEIEKRFEDNKSSKFKTDGVDKSGDPQESLMGLMRNMYESGDDDMKRMIAKAWTEGQEKKLSDLTE